jgi:type IV pilus assembly protein PilB
MVRKKRLGEILTEAGLINETQLASALNSQRTWGGKLGSTLVRMGFVKEEDLLRCLSAQLRLPSVDFAKIRIAPNALQVVPHRIAEKYNVIPVALKEEMGKKTVILAMSDPTNLDTISEIQFQTGVNVRPVVATESAISRAVDQHYLHQKAKEQYGYEKRVDLAQHSSAEEMVILHRGEEMRVSALEGLDPSELVRALVRVLLDKGVIDRKDLEDAVRRPV